VSLLSRPHLAVIAFIGIIVPRHIRADWREEWEAELRHRESSLANWDRLDRTGKRELLCRSSSAFRDAIALQRQRWEDAVVQDIRFGVRSLFKSPVFTSVALLTVALGIGTNTAIFSVVNALLLRPLDGVADPSRLVQVNRQYADRATPSDSSYPDYRDYRDESTTMSGLAVSVPTSFNLGARGTTERVDGEMVSANYFDVLGVSAAQGRLISPLDGREEDADDVVVLSERVWERLFDGDPSAVGTTIKLDGRSVVIVGVADPAFAGIRIGTPRDVWLPILSLHHTDPKTAARFDQRHASWIEVFGRLKPGATLDQARSEFSTIAARLEREHPGTNTHAGARVDAGLGHDIEVEQGLRRFAYLPFTAAMLVLLIACANVAALLLARSSARRREVATRVALGAGRVRIVRQLLTESALLALAGGGAGLAVGAWLTRWLRSLLPDRYLFLNFNLDFGVDWRVFTFMLSVAVATGVLFGVFPALQASRADVVTALKGPRTSPGGRSGTRARGALVITQVALSLVLLVAAGLCVRTLRNATAIDKGYDASHVLTARIDLSRQNYSEARGRTFQQQLIERLETIPGVSAAGLAVTLPLNDGRWEDAVRRAGDATRVQTFQNVVSTRYFDTISIPLVAGRQFGDADNEHAPRVTIVNQRLARMMWPDQSPIGQRLTYKADTLEVVGVARDIKGRNLFEPPGPMMYLPLSQYYQRAVVVHVRGPAAIPALAAAVDREVHALDPDLPVYSVKALDEHVFATLTPQRLLAYLISAFGVLALVLTGVGLYGLLSYTVTERTPEIGIRMALGATKKEIVSLFLSQGLRLTLVGMALGLAAAASLTRLMRSILFGVTPLDPPTLVSVAMLLITAASVACYVPARRAARSDPTSALREE
jgi:predicted permease